VIVETEIVFDPERFKACLGTVGEGIEPEFLPVGTDRATHGEILIAVVVDHAAKFNIFASSATIGVEYGMPEIQACAISFAFDDVSGFGGEIEPGLVIGFSPGASIVFFGHNEKHDFIQFGVATKLQEQLKALLPGLFGNERIADDIHAVGIHRKISKNFKFAFL